MKSYSEDSTNLTLQGNYNHFQLSTCIFLPIKLKVGILHWIGPGYLEFYLGAQQINLNPEQQTGMVDCCFNQLIIYVAIN